MLSMAVHRGMNVDLPVSARSVQSPESKLSVSVTVDEGQVHLFLDREQVSAQELENRLRAWKLGRDDSAEVLLFADRAVSYQQLYQVLDRISAAGVAAISLQAEQKR
jgi:biopolymer transport protein ExbD